MGYLHTRKKVLVEVVSEEDVLDFFVVLLPIFELLVEGDDLMLELRELGQRMESIDFELEKIEEGVEVFGLLRQGYHVGLWLKLHLLLF